MSLATQLDEAYLAYKADPSTEEAFYTKLRKNLQAIVHSKVLDTSIEDETEDIVQFALLTILQKLDSFKGDSRFSTWVFSVAENAVLMYFRDNTYPQELPLKSEAMFPEVEAFGGVEQRQLLSRILETLSDETDRHILALSLAGFPQEEIAKQLSMPYITIRRRFSGIIQTAKKELSPCSE